jgi:hypothetical protein
MGLADPRKMRMPETSEVSGNWEQMSSYRIDFVEAESAFCRKKKAPKADSTDV